MNQALQHAREWTYMWHEPPVLGRSFDNLVAIAIPCIWIAVCYGVIFFLLKLVVIPLIFRNKPSDIRHGLTVRAMSMINCSLVVPSVWMLLHPHGLDLDPVYGSTDESLILSIWAAGYFLYDTVLCLFDSTLAFVVHGLVCFGVYFAAALMPINQYFAAVFLCFEMSTIAMNISWTLKKVFQCSGIIMNLANMMFAISFLLVRVIWGNYMSYNVFALSIPLLAKEKGLRLGIMIFELLCNVVLTALNLLWMYKIILVVLGKNGDKKKEKTKKN